MSCEWLTVQEVADQLKVTKSAVHWWLNKGKLDYSTTPGGTRRVCKADLVQPGRKGPPSAD
jgi:excisionase family DNA binding protein